MSAKLMFLFIFLTALVPDTKESPIEGSTLPPEPIPIGHHHGIHTDEENKSMHHNEEESDATRKEDMDYAGNRSNYSRMLTLTTTLGYDDWWYLTTRRPRLSFKDFPGRPGVATWKEISPFSSGENRKSRKMASPTASGVSSDSWSFALNYHYPQNILCNLLVLVWLRCFCWT